MFKYETHLHTSPVSRCAVATVKQTLDFYKSLGYDGVFITNHFIDGNIGIDYETPYAEKLDFYFSDYEDALVIGKQIGIKVFLGIEMSYYGTDFLVYGLDKKWFYDHPEITQMRKSEELAFLKQNGAFIIQAHPFREANYIDHIRLFPRQVEGIEVINAERTDFENMMADIYAKNYELLRTAGSDNHCADRIRRLAGIMTEKPISSVEDYIDAVKSGKAHIFTSNN